MILRPYQQRCIDHTLAALDKHKNTLIVAPTGAGKSILLSALGKEIGGKQLYLQHRDELVRQNRAAYLKYTGGCSAGHYTATHKTWLCSATFASVSTLAMERNIQTMPPVDLLVLDEAHHAPAPIWKRIVDHAKKLNPNVLVAGFTATPERSDKKGLKSVFSNIADIISVEELVRQGFLVPPRGFVVDVGGTAEALTNIEGSDWGDQAEVETILNTIAVNDEVVRNWRDKAADRQTVVFCSTVKHAQDVCKAFINDGIRAACVHGGMKKSERDFILRAFARNQIQVITNAMVLTEGFDCQPVSCVILLRKCSAKSAMIQMIGRGLRIVDPQKFPGVKKRDCIVLDFGTSLLTHGDISADAALTDDREVMPGECITKICPMEFSDAYAVPDVNGKTGCGAELPAQTKTCPLCGFVFERLDKKAEQLGVSRVELVEMSILERSPFRYIDLFGTGCHMVASGFETWVGVFSIDGNNYHAIGGKGREITILVDGVDKIQAIARADDFMRENETDKNSKKTAGWMNSPASQKQVQTLNLYNYNLRLDLFGSPDMTRYQAACHLTFQKNRQGIEKALGVAA